MNKIIGRIAAGAIALYGLAIGVVYCIQERFIFFPEKLARDYHFPFRRPFEELNFRMPDGAGINALLFRADSAKGLIFYLHGNAGSLKSWGTIAKAYNDLGYDLFIPDYRGFGKSGGQISSEAQLHSDVRLMYDSLKKRYAENDIVILGYSIGTGPATRLASGTSAKLLILQAPYYNLAGLMRRYYPFIPPFVLKYKLETNRYISACRMPVVIFHGDDDEVISYQASLQLRKLLKPADTLIILKGQPHNGMSDNPEYLDALRSVLNK